MTALIPANGVLISFHRDVIISQISKIVNDKGLLLYPVQPHTSVSPSADSIRAVVSSWRKYVHEVPLNRLGGLNLPKVNLPSRHDHRYSVVKFH